MRKPVAFVRLDLARFGAEIISRPSDQELAAWVRSFFSTLAKGEGPDPWANELIAEAESFREKCAAGGRKGGGNPTFGKGTTKVPLGYPKPIHTVQAKQSNKEQERDPALSAPPPSLFPGTEPGSGKNGSINGSKNPGQRYAPVNRPKTAREHDQVWDAVARLFGFPTSAESLTAREKNRLWAVVRDIRQMGASSGADVESVFKAAKTSWNGGPPFSPEALVKWWRQFTAVRAEAAARPAQQLRESARRFREATGSWPSWYQEDTEISGISMA